MRWSLSLPVVTISAGEDLHLGPDDGGRTAHIALRRSGDDLEITTTAHAPADRAAPHFPEWYARRHLAVLLNPAHDHATKWQFVLDDTGRIIHKANYSVPGEEPADEWTADIPAGPSAAGEMKLDAEGGFHAILRIPADALWPAGNVIAGIIIKVGFHEVILPQPLCWPAAASDSPMHFGDLYREPPPLSIEHFVLPKPSWGFPSTLTLHGRAKNPDLLRGGHLEAACLLPDQSIFPQPPAEISIDGQAVQATLPISFPHHARWSNAITQIARLRLIWKTADGKLLWHADFPFSIDAGIIVRERYGRSRCEGGLPARPKPGDEDFIPRFRHYILSRLPDYQRVTTRDGAPSDFFLRDADGQADLDLADDTWPAAVARLLAARFGRWDDALCAAALWIYHPAVTRHSSAWHHISNQATIRSLPRVNGCFCDDTSRLGALLADEIGRKMTTPLRGLSMRLRGHLTTLVQTPIGSVVIDGMLGIFFHTLDNTRLATIEEMRRQRPIVERMWNWPRAHGHEFIFGIQDHIIHPPSPGRLNFPLTTEG